MVLKTGQFRVNKIHTRPQGRGNTVEPRFNEVPKDWGNLFFISRDRYIEHLD